MGKTPIKKLILISDINGLENSKWMNLYEEILSKEFEISTYCSLKLSEINGDQTKEEIHTQFVNGGIERASQNLVKLESESESVTIVAFSIGGAIAWKSALKGMKLDYLYAVSSTRLRKEVDKPKGELKLIYGENDLHKPEDKWYQQMEIIPRTLPDVGHDFYDKTDFIKQFASQIIWASGIIH